MVFHWSLSDRKSPQVSWTFIILANLNAVVWMVSTCLWFLGLPVLLPSLWRFFRVHQLQLVSLSLSYSIVFLVLWQGLSTYLSFIFTQWSAETAKFTIRQDLSFLLLLLLLLLIIIIIIIIIIICLFVCLFVMPFWTALLFTIFLGQPLKKNLCSEHTLIVQYLCTF